MTAWIVGVLVTLACLVGQLRWLRVAQREHYHAGRVLAMIGIWCRADWRNAALGAVLVLLCVLGVVLPVSGSLAWAWLLPALLALAWPLRLVLVGKAKKPAFTSRAKRLCVVVVLLQVLLAGLLALAGDALALLPLTVPFVMEAGLLLTGPLEGRLGRRWQVQAAERIRKVSPRVVAITGSYGKTSTKNYAAHLISGRYSVLASPASFNNVMGLSRAVNDRLVPGTEVFVAEMGTYGPGEIARLCEIFPPEVSAITTIGEAHLERMRNRETIVRAKSEILPPARTVVLNVDVPELARIADELAATKRVIRCSTEEEAADVAVRKAGEGWRLTLGGASYDVSLPAEVGHPINVAIAVGLALALDVPERLLLERIGSLPATPHRAETTTLPNGITVIDDTYNANPDGAAEALGRARRLAGQAGTVWTITPGMVELGPEQATRNAELAKAATATEGMRLCVVGRTNRRALTAGVPERTAVFASREDAMRHVLASAGAGDVVLYENDLPDHYP